VKAQQKREVTLGLFSSPDKKEEFDYGIGKGGPDKQEEFDYGIGIGVEDGGEMELVDLPDINI